MNPAFRLAVLATRPLRRIVELTVLYYMDLRRELTDFRADVTVEISRASRSEVEEAARLSPGFRESFLARHDAGLACFVARIDGRVVAYNWTMYSSGEDDGDVIVLGPGEIYTLDAFTVEEWRGRGIHVALLAHMLQAAKEAGYTDAYTLASVLKRGSRKGVARLGWTETGRALRVRGPSGRFRVVALRGSRRPLG
jgi:GNAT superfamily N-acetyltransferase